MTVDERVLTRMRTGLSVLTFAACSKLTTAEATTTPIGAKSVLGCIGYLSA